MGGELIGRVGEVARLRELAAGVAVGRGAAVWVEGEPGIGKSSVLAAGLAEAGASAFWGTCDELGQRLPLRVLTACFGVAESSADPDLAAVAALLNGGAAAGGVPVDAVAVAVTRLVDWVGRVAVARPAVVVVDDAQWADGASLSVVAELARLVGQLPVLLAVAARPVPRRAEVLAARRAVTGQGGAVLRLGPLPDREVAELVGALVGGRPGAALREAAAAAGGNPLYVRELVDALVRDEQTTRRRGEVDLADAGERAPVSLADAISDRLAFLSESTVDVLRLAAVLGAEFAVPDLSTMVERPPSDLVPVVQEAITAGVLAESERGLRFRHELIRQALAGSVPAGLRSALHAQVARSLLAASAGVERVAEQLLAVDPAVLGEGWVLDWLAVAGPRLVNRAPDTAAELLRAALDAAPPEGARRAELYGHLLTALWLNGRNAEVEQLARQVIAQAGDTERTGAAAWRMVYAIARSGRMEEAVQTAEQALVRGWAGGRWAARLRALQAMSLNELGRYDELAAAARSALADGERASDGFAIGYALHALSSLLIRERDFRGLLDCYDRGLAAIGDDVETTDLRLIMTTNRANALVFMDRLDEAGAAFRAALRLAETAAPARLATIRVTAAELWYETGAWDDALAELTDVESPLAWQRIDAHAVRALIALHRDEQEAAGEAMREVTARGPVPVEGRAEPWIAARALAAERARDPRRVLAELAPLLDPRAAGESLTRFRVLPAGVRAALAIGDAAAAADIVRVSAAEAARGGTRSLRAAAGQCHGLLEADGAMLAAAAAEFAAVGRPLLAGQAFEDAAVAYARRGDQRAARSALDAALGWYAGPGASYDARRAAAQLRPYGLRPAQREARRRPAVGWAALTPAESQVATLLQAGLSNPDIAAELFLSRRTVESHVSRILMKLGAKSRLEVIAAARPAGQGGA